MGFPIKKRAATAMHTSSDSDNHSGLDLLSAVIDSRLVPNHDGSSSTEETSVALTATTPVDSSVEDEEGCDDSSISDNQSNSTTSQSLSKAHYSTHKRAKTFPEVLLDILSNNDNEYIVGWLPHGKSFAIHDSNRFSSLILPKYFRRVIFRSFIRKLNRWGFRSTKRSVSGYASTFEHKHFRRDEPELCAKIRCKSNPTRSAASKPVDVGIEAVNTAVNSSDDVTKSPNRPAPVSAFAVAATQAAICQSRHLPLLNTGSLSRLPFLNEEFRAEVSRAASLNRNNTTHIRTNYTSATKSFHAAAAHSVLNQAHHLSFMNSVSMPCQSFTSGGNFSSRQNEVLQQVDLSNELIFRELQRRQLQQALMSYLLYRQE